MEDKLLILHKNLIKDGYDMPDYDTFKSDMADPNNSLALHKNLIKDGYDMPEYDTFIGDMGLKKKEFSLESFAKSENVFQTLGLSSKESSTPKLPLQSSKKPEPVSYEDTLVEDFSISAFIKAQNKYPQYLKQEQEKIISEKQEEINDAINALQDNYKSKIEANPEQTKKLQAEYEKEAQKVVELRAGTLPSQIERLVKEKDYQYLGKGDIKEIEKTISDILQQPTTHEDKINSIEDFKRNFMYKLSSMPEEYKDPVKKELEDVVARKSLVNEMGMPTILGWKQEVKSKKQKIENAIQQEISDYKDKYPQLKEVTNQFGGIDMRLAQEYIPEKEFARLTNLIDMQGKANKFFNKTLELPNDAGSFWEGFKSEGEAIKTAGLVDLFDALDLSSVISKQKKGGTLTPAEQALIDAHGILQVAESSEELGKAYTRGKGIGRSVVWMEQFVLTSGIGKAASGTAIKVLGSSVKNKVVQNITKGIGSAVGRTPVLVGGYTEAIQRASGSPELSKQGVWEVDPAKAESVWKAIGKGAYQNFSEAFSEEAGGFLKGTKAGSAIGRRLGLTRLPKVVRDFARVTAFQPLGELPEEYLASLMQTPVMGDQTLKEAFSWENVWETAVQVGIMTGALGSAGLPSVISHNQKRARNKELIDIFGRDNISTLRDAILDGDIFAFEHAMTMALEGKGYKELKGLSLEKAQKRLTGYVTTLAQERGARVAQEEITSVASTGEPTIEVEEEEEAAPTFKINNKEFTTKEELFAYLEENATVEDGTRIKEGWMETKEIPDQATLSAINEWEATKKTTVESKYTEATEEEKERMKRPELTEEKKESDESDKKDKESVAASKLQDAELRGEDIEGMDREESQDDTKTGDRTTGDAAIAVQETEEFTEREQEVPSKKKKPLFKEIPKADQEKNNLIDKIKEYNNLTDAQKKKAFKLQNEIKVTAQQLNFDLSEKRGKFDLLLNGKSVRKTPIKFSKEAIEEQKTLSEYDNDFQSFVNDVIETTNGLFGVLIPGLKNSQRRQAANDIRTGKKTVASAATLNALESMYNSGGISVWDESSKSSVGVSIAEIKEAKAELIKENREELNNYSYEDAGILLEKKLINQEEYDEITNYIEGEVRRDRETEEAYYVGLDVSTEGIEEEKAKPKAEQLKEKEAEIKNRLANNLEGLMGAIGGITEVTGDQRASVLRYLSDIIRDIGELTALKGEQLYERVKEYLKENKVKLPDDLLEEAINTHKEQVEPAKTKPVKETPKEEKKKEDTKYRRTQINALIQDETLQQKEVAKIVDANKERYVVLHRAEAVEEAKKLIDEQGVRNATDEFTQPTRRLDDLPTRQVARLVLLEFYSRAIIDPNASARDKTEAFNAMDKLQAIIAREATKAGQSNAMLYAWRSMQPSGLLAYVERKIAKSNDKTLNKKVGKTTLGEQLDSLFETLSEDSKKIISDILSGKEITIPQTTKATAKDIPKRKTVPRERIKREQEFRKNLIAEYKAKHGGGITLRAGVPLDVEQIEFGGALLASYVKEGIYRIQDAIDQLTKELREAGIDPTEERIDQLLNLNKSADETFREYIERIESKARMRAGEKLISKRISDVITEHWTEHDELRRTLAQKLMDEAGLTEAEANRLEKQVLEKFDKEILKRSQDKLAKLLGTKRIPVEKTNKGIVGDMVKLINLGALNEQLYRELFAEKFKLVKLTEQHKEEILRLASNVQLASGKGFIERDATIRLAKYIYELYPESQQGAIFETWISLAYANMLFGPSTSILNMWSAGSNLTSKPIREITNLSKWLRVIKDAKKGEADIYNPFGDMFYVPMLLGSKAGIDYAHEVYRNGDLDNKYIEDIAKKDRFKVQQLERDKYGKAKRYKPVTVKIKGKEYDLNIFNKYKYSGRNLSAQDKLMLFTSYEVEIAHILRDKLKNKDLRGRALTREVMSILRGERMDMEQIEKTLQEDAALYKQMNNEEMTDLQKNIHRRELMLDQMPLTPEERQEAEQLARSNIFTDDRYGAIASIARAIGMASNSNPLAGLVVKPFIPFTKVVGNVSEYMLDHTPFYGFLRANGWSVTGIYARMRGEEARSAQMGERGSHAYYEQMGRAWLGTLSFLLFGMMFLGKDEDDFLELSGGYTKEGWKKRGRENVLPPYTIRIGKVKIPYMNIPGLAIPLALIGNVNDGLKLKQDEGSLMERLTLSLLLDASRDTVLMFKDMSFLEGAQNLVTMIGDALSTEESRWESVGESALKSYLGFLARPLPQNNNAIQQIWKIFDPESMPQKDVSAMLRYAGGVQHFGKYPSVDQLGDHIKTFPGETVLPWTHWVGLKGSDDRWAFLAKYNAIPNRLYNRTMPIETKDGIERRHMEEDELYHYCRRTGTLFSNYIEEYRSDMDKVKKRASDIIEREKSNGEIEKVNGVRFDMEGLWSRAKDNAETELFRWGTVKETMPETWNLITKHEAYHHYQSQKQTDGYKYTKSELYEFNNHATVFYAQRIKSYLQSNMPAIDKKRMVDGESKFQITIDDMWDKARDDAERIMKRHIGKNTKEEK